MGWLTVVNSILALRIVQYLLVLALVVLLACAGWLLFKNNTLKLQKAYFETEYSKVSAGLAVQNESIIQQAEKTKLQKEELERAVAAANSQARILARKLKDAKNYVFTGTCEQKITQSLELVRGVSK